jgi:hypothetical protein
MRTYKVTLLLLSALGGGCSVASATTNSVLQDESISADTTKPAPVYGDVEDALANGDETQYEAWRGIYTTLQSNFDDVCGDTYCGSDYSNLEPIRLRCSFDPASGLMKNCAYVFAGSYEVITPATGTIKVTAKTFSCHLPVSGIALTTFMSTLTAAGTTPPLRRLLPGTSTSIYDALGGCLP